MKRILFILLPTIPFIGFGQKFIEKKIQTSNGTIISGFNGNIKLYTFLNLILQFQVITFIILNL